MYYLRCPHCKAEKQHVKKSDICIACNHVMTIVPLSDGAFERIDETGYEKPQKGKSNSTVNRPASQGGVVFDGD